MSTTQPKPRQIIVPFSLDSVLDEFVVPIKNRGLSIAQNVVYRRVGGFGKRTGTAPYGGGPSTGLAGRVISGTRWYRGIGPNNVPAATKYMVVQSNDAFYVGNDTTGAFTSIGSVTVGSQPAFYATAFDPAESAVTATPASDILIMAYGSGPPKKWDGTHFTALSPTITNFFAGATFYHEHVWFWGDQNFPDTVFATDLGNPESYTFSSQFGGYKVGRGDGDPFVQRCLPAQGLLYVFKQRSIYTISGFDFYSGDYQFQDTPLVEGIGTPSPFSVARLRNSLIWWSGQTFYRLGLGTSEPENLGTPITNTIAIAAQKNQSVIRAVAGDFLVKSGGGYRVYNNVYLCAIDGGAGFADTILMFDEQVTAERGKPAWTVLTGLKIGSFIPWDGPGDQKLLYFGDGATGQVYLFGGDAYADVAADGTTRNAPQVILKTGRNDNGTPNQTKHLDRLFVDAETNTTNLNVTISSDTAAHPSILDVENVVATGGLWGSNWGSFSWGPTVSTAYVSTELDVVPELDGKNFTVQIVEQSNASAYEIVALSYHAIEEAYEH